MEGCEVVVVVGVADWKSSNSSSSAPLACIDPSPFPTELEIDCFAVEPNSFGGVSGGMSSSNPRMSISGSLGFGGSAALALLFARPGSDFFVGGEDMAPSSNSSYSSNRSFLPESWNPDVFPPNPPPSP